MLRLLLASVALGQALVNAQSLVLADDISEDVLSGTQLSHWR